MTQYIDERSDNELVNTPYLEEKIKKSGKKKSFLAEKIGCSRSYFFRKLNNQVDFELNEVSVLCKELNISTLSEKEKIFFTH